MAKASTKSGIWMKCTQCVQQFNAVEDLEDHLEKCHPPRKQYACNNCAYTADRQHEIDRHMNRVHPEKQSLNGRRSSSEMKTPIRTGVKRKSTPVPAGDAEKEKGQLKFRPKTSMSPSMHSRSAPSTATAEDSTGPTARSVVAEAKKEVAQKGLKSNQSKERKGRYCRVIETVVLPDGKMFRVETEKWDE